MDGKVFIVTGANTGIGKAIAAGLAAKDAGVVIVSRSEEKGEAALEDIRNSTGNSNVELMQGDLSSIESCRSLGYRLLEKYPAVHSLINNAGIWKTQCELNSDGLEMTFMVNHMAPFILSNILLEQLKKNAPSRIVNVNAGLYVKGNLDINTTPYGKDFSRFGTYANTKLCNVLFTCELARRIEGSGVTVNAVHPGVIKTGLGETGGLFGVILRAAKRFWGTPEEGAEAPIHLSLDPAFQNVNGKYFMITEEMELTEKAKDRELACRLWEFSEKTAGL